MNPKNFRTGRSTRKFQRLVPNSSMLASNPAEARLQDEESRVQTVKLLPENTTKAATPPSSATGASCCRRRRENSGWRTHKASREPRAKPSRLNHVLNTAACCGKWPVNQQTIRSAGVPSQISVSTRARVEDENLRTSDGQSR